MHRYAVVDVFTAEPFAGNPAAVVLLHDPADAGWMQQVAVEFNLSETAFAVPRPDSTWDLRWFTPAAEVDFCGHATVATAHTLWERTLHPADRDVVFHTRAGDLGVARDGDELVLDGPTTPAVEIPAPTGLEDLLGTAPVFVGTTEPDDPLIGNLFVVLPSERDVVDLDIDVDAVAALPHGGLVITAEADGHAYDCVSRYFTPRFGVDEDPVTGSAHCTIGPYWAEQVGRTGIRARQASPRGGDVNVTVADDRTHVAGHAVTIMAGELYH